MEPKKLFYMECHLAGREYHDADEVWEDLKVGTVLEMRREKDNDYDPQAIAVYLVKYIGKHERRDEYKLGYIPSTKNSTLALFYDMGWGDAFECRISQMKPDEHYEQQVRLTIRIKRRTLVEPKVR